MNSNELAPIFMLDGDWDFELAGQQGSLTVPGTWEAQGFSHRIDGPAHYRKSFQVPADWQGKRIELQFDAVSYHAEITVNDRLTYTHMGMWTAFGYDISEAIQPGAENTIILIVYKPGEKFPMRESLAGFLPDVCTPFGGIWQSVRLVAFDGPSISALHIHSDPSTGAVTASGTIDHIIPGTLVTEIFDEAGNSQGLSRSPIIDGSFEEQVIIEEAAWWSPGTPTLYTVEIRIEDLGGKVQCQVRRKFGFRELARDDEQLLLNGQPVFLRGLLNWGWYPEILCPAPDEVSIRDEFRRVREFGYNMVKLCLYIPSPLYFEIADEEGMLLWLEMPMWLPQVTERMRQQAVVEYADILRQVQHHPSIIIYSLGCELGHSVDAELLGKLNALLREATRGVLVCDNSGSGEAYGGLSFDYADFNDYHFYADLHYFTPLLDHFRRDWREPRPWIFGEFCDADDFRNLAPIAEAYSGTLPWWLREHNPIHKLSALAYSQQTERMTKLDLGFDDAKIQDISRQQSFVVRKTILEKVRSRSGMGGYVVTGLRDTPLATSSMFDDLTRPKYDAIAFRRFNQDTVLILEQGRARCWTNGGDRPDPVDIRSYNADEAIDLRIVVSHAGPPLPPTQLRWQVTDPDGHIVAMGNIESYTLRPDHKPRHLADVRFNAPQVDHAITLDLQVNLGDFACNQWPLWIYPSVDTWPEDLLVHDPTGELTHLDDLLDVAEIHRLSLPTQSLSGKTVISSMLSDQLIEHVRSGGKAVLLQSGDGTIPAQPCPFWREAIKLIYDHPVLADFPHAGYADAQFYHLAADYALDLDSPGPELSAAEYRPIIRRLDARQFTVLDYLAELSLNQGTLIVSSLPFTGGMGDQVIGLRRNTAGRYMLHAILKYLEGNF